MSYIYYKVWFNFDIDMIQNDDIKPISEHKNINTILNSDSVDAADIASQRVNLYKYKYFINLYERAYKFYTSKVSYLDIERKKNYTNNTTEIYNEDYIRHIAGIDKYGNAIATKNNQNLEIFKNNIKEEGLAKEAKRVAEEQLQKTRDKLKELEIEKLKNTFSFNKEKRSIIKEKLKNIKEEEKNRDQIFENNKEESKRLRKLLKKN